MNNDEILIVQCQIPLKPQRANDLRELILKQKETGVIVLPHYCTVITKPKDIDIQVEVEKPLIPSLDINISEGIWQHRIYNSGNWYDIPTICSECGHEYTEYVCGYEWEETGDLPNFCPHCGVKMRAETDEELKIRREQFVKEE